MAIPLFNSCSPLVREPAIKSMVGSSGRQRVQADVVQNLEIMVPDYEEQKRISGILKSLDDKIAANTEVNKNLLEQAQSIFTQEFLMFDRIPDGWQESSLLGIADYLNGLAMQKYRPKDDEQGLPVLKIKELRQGSCDFNSELCSPSIKPEYIVHDGDVIFSWSGSLLVDLWCGGTCGLNQHLFKVTSSTYDKWFYYAWTDHHLQKFAAIAADMATTMGHIKREELSKAEVLIPSQSDYDRIGGLLAPLYDLVIANRIENRKLASLRDELLPQLMSGQKYTIDSYDINAFTRTLFDMLDRRICNLSPDVKREFKKLYIAYKLDTNFVDIVVQKQRLRISLNMKFSEIHDPKGLCKDITGLGRWGNGDVEVFFEHTSEIDDVMELIEQSYSKQADE